MVQFSLSGISKEIEITMAQVMQAAKDNKTQRIRLTRAKITGVELQYGTKRIICVHNHQKLVYGPEHLTNWVI